MKSPAAIYWNTVLALAVWFATGFLLSYENARAEVRIVDDSGGAIVLERPAQRIIPLYAALGESLVAMGLSERIVAGTVSDDSLPGSLPRVGTHMRPNLELIAGLKPDLVVQFEGRSEAGQLAESLNRLGIPVARFRIGSFAELFSCLDRLGVLTGEETKAEKLAASMRARLEQVRSQMSSFVKKPGIFFEIRYPNLLGAGGGSMLTDIIAAAGGENCLQTYQERMVRLSEETLTVLNPDIYLVQQGAMNKNPVSLKDRSHFRTLKAVADGQVFLVPESRFSRPGPQSVDAVEELAGIILEWQARQEKEK